MDFYWAFDFFQNKGKYTGIQRKRYLKRGKKYKLKAPLYNTFGIVKFIHGSKIQKAHSRHSNLNKMKRQRNTQQVKEHEKCPLNQTKEEEIGNIPQKEFRIMIIIKMIQNLENKMELQINSLETKLRRCKKCLIRT